MRLALLIRMPRLAAPARSAAIPALVAAPVAGHDGAALGAERGVCDYRGKRQCLLRVRFGRAKLESLAGFRGGVFLAQEFGAEPAEDVIHDGLGIGHLRISRPAT